LHYLANFDVFFSSFFGFIISSNTWYYFCPLIISFNGGQTIFIKFQIIIDVLTFTSHIDENFGFVFLTTNLTPFQNWLPWYLNGLGNFLFFRFKKKKKKLIALNAKFSNFSNCSKSKLHSPSNWACHTMQIQEMKPYPFGEVF